MSSTAASSSNTDDAETLRRNRILNSKLYFDVTSDKVPLIYSSSYDIAFLGIEKLHPFDSSKWGRICRFLIKDGIVDQKRVVEPLEAKKDDLLVVHSESYLKSLNSSLNVSMIVEVPPVAILPNCLVQQKVLHPFRKQVGGTILAAKLAKERGWAINVGGGFHHCSAEKGGGFCVYADISLCIHFAFVRLNISRVMIIDLDAHQGNGHEMDFSEDRKVFILDMYNPGIYPLDFEARRYIDLGVEIQSGTATNEYLTKLDHALELSSNVLTFRGMVHEIPHKLKKNSQHCLANLQCRKRLPELLSIQSLLLLQELYSSKSFSKVAEKKFDPDLIVYNAGTDILDGDPLGRLKISPDGIAARDEKVFRFARERNIPLLMLTSGGYMKSSAKVIADSIINLSKKSLIDMSLPAREAQ